MDTDIHSSKQCFIKLHGFLGIHMNACVMYISKSEIAQSKACIFKF